MNKSGYIAKFLPKKCLFVVFVSVSLLTIPIVSRSEMAPAQAREANKQKIVRPVAQKWIQIGMEQYKRGFFKSAEQSFLRAQDYQKYLAAAEREKLNELLEKTHIAILERERILEHIQTADELVEQDQLIKAKAHLEKVKDSEFLAEGERNLIAEGLKKIDNQLAKRKKEIDELYNRSVEFYRNGQLEKAREGFIKVVGSGLFTAPAGKTAEDYLLKIDGILAQRAKPLPSVEVKPPEELPKLPVAVIEEDKLPAVEAEPAEGAEQPVVQERKEPVVVTVAEPKVPEVATDKGGYIEVIKRKRNILRSHTRAVVNDAVAKAQNCINQGEFDKAKEAVETAEWTVNKNQLHLGDDVFKQYSSELKQLAEKIVQGKDERARQLQKQKRIEAVEAQRQYREQMKIDRSKRIAELTDNAMAYQKQQRYEEALGQLESLLAIEPLNDRALILKQTLEDTINFRKQLEVQKEKDRERVATLIKTDESMIPYAEELTYPKNWREIVAKRKPEEAIGYDIASAAVYKQLDQIVDLSELTPEMPLNEAIEELKNSVEPPLKIVVLWRDLYTNADIDQTTPINMDAISAIPLGTALELLLKSVSGGFAELGYVVEKGVITVATVESLPSKLETLVYDVSDLLGRPADFYALSGGDVSVDVETAGGVGFEEEDEMDRETLAAEAAERAAGLVVLIQETVEPDSWYDTGGEGTITVYENKKLIVHQKREVHNKIAKLLKEMRKALGQQVAIEARFLLVGENFLEDIGLDINFYRTPAWEGEILGWSESEYFVDPPGDMNHVFLPVFGHDPSRWPLPGEVKGPVSPSLPYQRLLDVGTAETGKLWGVQRHAGQVFPEDTQIPGSWPSLITAPALALGLGGMILDTLQVDLLLRATQARRDATSLTAPKVSVLSGESASLRVQRVTWYPTDVEFQLEEVGDFGDFFWTVEFEDASIVTGTLLNITPTITPDKRNVLLNIVTELRDFLGWEEHSVLGPITSQQGRADWIIRYPETEISRVETRVSVPDGGTLLLGGQKITTEVELESGVPVLSKIPFLGRLFSNRSKVRDEKILLILVKPTIILQEEAEAEAIAAMQ